jgi:hypothetical protein
MKSEDVTNLLALGLLLQIFCVWEVCINRANKCPQTQLDALEMSVSLPDCFTFWEIVPGTHLIGDWVRFKLVPDAVE